MTDEQQLAYEERAMKLQHESIKQKLAAIVIEKCLAHKKISIGTQRNLLHVEKAAKELSAATDELYNHVYGRIEE